MISVIIPTFNEEEHIRSTIQSLWKNDHAKLVKEIIVVDGGSTDATVPAAECEGVNVVISPKKGRAAQMNFGASLSKEEVLYFLHADSIPPINFTQDIREAVKAGSDAGCFMLQFDIPHWFLKANCWFTRFDVNAFHYGDQSLYVKASRFFNANGFSEDHVVFEDYEMIAKLKKYSSFKIIKRPVVTSARKYIENGIYKMQGIFYLMYFLYRLGYSQERLVSTYRSLIRQDKI